jgi:hypothetical protein
MADQTKIVWTVLPNGLVTSNGVTYLRLTVSVGPRLYGTDTQLSAYSDFYPNWPNILATDVSFDFLFKGTGGTATLPGIPDPTLGTVTSDPTTWGYLFPGTTLVTPYKFQDWSPRFIQTIPATDLYTFLKSQYQNLIATYAAEAPLSAKVRHSFIELWPNGIFPSPSEYKAYLKQVHGGHNKTFPKPSGPAEAMLQAELFYHRGSGELTGRSDEGDGWHYAGTYTPQELDFHQQISAIMKFPALQRRIGTAIDLAVPVSQIPSGNGSVRLTNPLLGASGDITPQTMYTRTATSLTIASSSGSLHNGFVDLNGTNFTVAEIDVDGTAVKFAGYIRQLNSSADNDAQTQARTHQAPTNSPPAIRSGGLGLFESGRASELAAYLPTSLSNNTIAEAGNGSTLQFYAEDLLQGYRVDIWDTYSTAWHSLHKRDLALSDPTDGSDNSQFPGTYEFKTNSGPVFWQPKGDDEGLISMGMTSDPNGPSNGGPGPDVYLHELVWRWMGWSLSVQRPNMFLDKDDNASAYDGDASIGPGVNMITHFGPAAGSLPRLRFGRGYRFRARVVDVAGNSPPASSTDTTYESPASSNPPFVYRRFEPVITPAVVLHDPVAALPPPTPKSGVGSPGESVHRMVIRSNIRPPTSTYLDPAAEQAFLAGLGYTSIPPESTRWIVPPRISQLMAEHHGLFDTGSGGAWNSNALAMMAQYDQSLNNNDDGTDPVYGDGGVYPDPQPPFPNQTLPYLPDIMCAGASFVGLPGVAAGAVFGPKGTLPTAGDSLSFTGTWPDFQPFRLTLAGLKKGAVIKAPDWDSTNRILTVYVEQAEMVQDPVSKTWSPPTASLSSFLPLVLKIGSYPNQAALNLFGVLGWLEEYQAAGHITMAQLDKIGELAYLGLTWALTPSQDITFVNATQQPIIRPKFKKLRAARQGLLGATYTLLADVPMHIDGDSTIKVDITARWTDPQDDGSIDPCPQPNTTDPNPPHHIIPGLPKEIDRTAHVVEIPLQPGTTSINFEAPELQHKFGDTKHHNVYYTATGTSRFTEYFPTGDPAVPTTSSSPEFFVNVPSSARPQSPNVLYAIPAFGWFNKTKNNLTTSLREGGLLRVYLDRPFYSSGPDELLGVVLINDAKQITLTPGTIARRAIEKAGFARRALGGVTTVLEKYVTQWGMDPLWVSPEIKDPPMLSAFPTASKTASNVFLEELGGRKGKVPVSVAGFPVTYDPDRCMYFCDIPFTWGDSYYPFVRLALATFQPNSITLPDTVHLSRVIVNDFVQLAPHRFAQVKSHVKASDAKYVELAVTGVSTGSPKSPGTYMEVTVEQQAPQVGTSSDELAWVPVPNLDVIMTPAAVPKTNYTVWSTHFDLPHAVGSIPFRLIIREYELYPQEWGLFVYTQPSEPATKRGKVRGDSVAPPPPKDRRLVYAATLEI